MLRLNPRQRAVLIDKLPDVANLAVGAMLFGQFLSDRAFSLVLGFWGVGVWLFLVVFTIVLAGGKDI